MSTFRLNPDLRELVLPKQSQMPLELHPTPLEAFVRVAMYPKDDMQVGLFKRMQKKGGN